MLETLYGTEKVENLEISEFDNLVADILAKVDELNPLSDYHLGLELDTFYAKVNIHNPGGGSGYGAQLTDVIEQLANIAEASNDNDKIEEFLMKLSMGASFRGGDSHLEWYPSSNIIVTNNPGKGNGFYDIPITDNEYLGPTALWQLKDLSASNVRHLAYHIMFNFWHLSKITDEQLIGYRETALTNYANNHPNKGCTNNCKWQATKETHSSGQDRYIAQWKHYVWQTIEGALWFSVNTYQTGATTINDLTLANWADFYDAWKAHIDTLE